MVTTFYPPHNFGGDGIFVHRLSHALADRGHSVVVIHNRDAFELLARRPARIESDDHPGVERRALHSRAGALDVVGVQQMGRPLRHAATLKAALQDPTFDVIHFHNVSLMGAPALFECGNALKLYTTHEHWLVCPMHVLWRYGREPCTDRTCLRCQVVGKRPPQLWRYTEALEKSLEHIDLILAPSEFTLNVHRELGIKRPMQKFPHFVPDPGCPPPHQEKQVHARPYYLFVGRLETIKGLDFLIETFREYRDADLLVIGDGTQRSRLMATAADLSHVHFLGGMAPTDIAPFYREARAVIMPSVCYEVFGLAVIEGFSFGAPALVNDIGALPELIDKSSAGFSYRTREELIGHMKLIDSDSRLRHELRVRAREAYCAHWTRDHHVGNYEGLVQTMLERHHSGAPR